MPRKLVSNLRAVRTWKRDGSVNVMSLEAATGNLRQNGHAKTSEGELAEAIIRGETLGTARADFRLLEDEE